MFEKINRRDVLMRIGFTGTRQGMTERQKIALSDLLSSYAAAILHHGDAIGADAEAHEIAVGLGCAIVIHPPAVETQRAFKGGNGDPSGQALSCVQQGYRARNGAPDCGACRVRRAAAVGYLVNGAVCAPAGAPDPSTDTLKPWRRRFLCRGYGGCANGPNTPYCG